MKSKNLLSATDITLIVVSLVIGMGIFKNPAIVAASSGTETNFFLVWMVGGFIALCGALTYAEIGLRLPATGGYYKVFAECYHPSVGFSVNAIILISNAASLAVVALIGSDYVSDLIYGQPADTFFNVGVAIVAVILFFGVNLFGLRTSSDTQNVLIVIKVAAMIILIASIFKGISIETHGYDKNAKIFSLENNSPVTLFLISLIPTCFAYGGYQQTINFGGEVKRPGIIPKGIIIGIIVVILLYLLINVAYTQVIGFEKMKNATAIGALLCEVWFGKNGGKIFDALMFLSVLAYVNITLMSNPRVMYAMSKDKVLPKLFSYRHPKTEALVPGLAIMSALTIIITFFGKGVDNILNFTMFLDSIGMSTSAAALFVLRKRKKGALHATGLWNKITPALAAIFVFSYFLIAVAVVIKDVQAAIIGSGLLILFLILYFLFYHKKGLSS